MDFYHGSSVKGLTLLEPRLSEHGRPYVYFAKNRVVAAFYTVHCVKRPYNWFPYGFTDEGIPVYEECYPDALADVYKGKTGYLYRCDWTEEIQNPTGINCACISEVPVSVELDTELPDVYEWFLLQERQGNLRIRRFREKTSEQRKAFQSMILTEIETEKLWEHEESDYAKFLSSRFPEIWKIREVEEQCSGQD